MKWLIPRLPSFQKQHSDAEIRLFTGVGPLNEIKMVGVDLAIRRLEPSANKAEAKPFLSSKLIAVCAPELIAQDRPVSLADIARLPLIEAATAAVSWREWLATAMYALPDTVRFSRFEHMFFAMEAALEGLGIALLPSALVLDDIAANRLVAAWHLAEVYDRDYSFVVSTQTRNARLVASFTDWLLAEGRESDALQKLVLPVGS
jgi:LysR family glycine cleavage system transcriptional activator